MAPLVRGVQSRWPGSDQSLCDSRAGMTIIFPVRFIWVADFDGSNSLAKSPAFDCSTSKSKVTPCRVEKN